MKNLDLVFIKISLVIQSVLSRVRYSMRPHSFGFPRIRGKLLCLGEGRIEFGQNCVVNGGYVANPVSLVDRTIFSAIHPSSRIIFGSGVGISAARIFALKEVRVGSGSMIGANVMIFDNDFHHLPLSEGQRSIEGMPVHIGRRVFIGSGAIILKGVSIGDDSIIGAGAIVRNNVGSGVTVI